MSTIQKISNKKGTSYRVLIRKKNLPKLSRTFTTKKEAKQFALFYEFNQQSQFHKHQILTNLSLNDLVKDYLINEYKGTRPQQQRSRLNHWTKLIGTLQVSDITKEDIKLGLSRLPNDLSNATINKYKKVASVVFNYGIREYNLTENPTLNIRSLPEKKGRTRFLSDNERKRLFKACRASRWNKLYLLVLMAITTGARRGELLNLRWIDIDFTRKTAHVLTSKNGEQKVLPLTNDVILELQKFKLDNRSLIFNSEIKPNKPYEFFNQWSRVRKEAELEDFRFHDLRHTTASYLAQSGASLIQIAEILGHKQIEVTKRYAHLCIEHKSNLINRVMGSI